MRASLLSRSVAAAGLAAAISLAACSKSDDAGTDTGAAAAPGTATGTDTGAMAGMDHSKMAGMNRPAAKDADQEFLRMMVDHHEGMVQMVAPAMDRASNAAAKADAKKLHDKQKSEQQQMVGMLQSAYGDSIHPMTMPSNKAMSDTLQATPQGPAYDRMLYHHVVMHHREGVKMVDDFMPRLTKPDVKQMAQKMKDDQQKEIAEFERKMNALPPGTKG